ncbi:MAG: hypothetical protein ACE5Z5_11410 [Candidatus Bathyarchaeia archaeon]
MSAESVEVIKRLQELRTKLAGAIDSIDALLSELGAEPSPRADTGALLFADQMKRELRDNLKYVDLSVSEGEVRLSPKRFLGSAIFRSIAEVVRRHEGRWDSRQQVFIIPIPPETAT